MAFFIQRLSPTQARYSIVGYELTAISLMAKHFRFLLHGRQSTIVIDHKPLCYSLNTSCDWHSSRIEDALTRGDINKLVQKKEIDLETMSQ